MRNQDLDRLVEYVVCYADSAHAAAIINANALGQQAVQVGANELIMTLELDPGYVTTGIKARITARGKAQPQQGATQPVADIDESEINEFEKVGGETLEDFEHVLR